MTAGNSTLPAEAQRADEALDREREQRIADLRWLMAHAAGRRIAWQLLDTAGIYRTSFHTSGSVTAFNEGARNVGLRLLAEIHEHEPDAYLLMLKECRQ